YAEVRAEQRRELGIEDSPPEITAEKSHDSGSESQLNASSLKEALERFNHSRTPSASSRSSRKSSHTAVSDQASSQIRIQGDRSTPGRQSVSAVEMTSQRRSSVSSQQSMSSQNTGQNTAPFMVSQQSQQQPQQQQQQQLQNNQSVQYSSQLEAMQHLKEQLEKKTRMIEDNIQQQLDELRQIQVELQSVQGQSLQMFQQNGGEGLNLTSAQTPHGSVGQQGGALSMQGQVVPAAPLQNSIQQQLPVQAQSQQQTLLRDQSTALAQVR
ncbi:hypothetical protein ILYODFUR_035291, partial [Ilyodon furcidens]